MGNLPGCWVEGRQKPEELGGSGHRDFKYRRSFSLGLVIRCFRAALDFVDSLKNERSGMDQRDGKWKMEIERWN